MKIQKDEYVSRITKVYPDSNSTLTVDDGDNPSNVSAVVHDTSPKSVSSEDANARGITFNHDGTKMYVTGTTNDKIYEYTLTSAFDISTATYRGFFNFNGNSFFRILLFI